MATMTHPYDELSDAQQIEALRPVALRAAAAFGLEPATLVPLLHAYNTTFELGAADGRRFALRVGTNSQSTPAHAIAQQSWIAAIAEQTEVLVARPQRTSEGQWFVEVDSSALGRPLLVTVAAWLDGEDADALGPDAAAALGRTMAALHVHAETWQLPEGGALPRFVEPLFGDRDLLEAASGLSDDDREVLRRSRQRAGEAFDRLLTAPLRPLHADLHGGNLKWHEGRLAVFDFDDAGLGSPVLDLAISTFYLRGEDPALEAAMRTGYQQLLPLPEADPADFEALVASRQLLLANALQLSTTADLKAAAADYLQTSLARLRHWLATGTFTRAVG